MRIVFLRHSLWDALCSQHFEYGSNYGHVTFSIQKHSVEPEAVSQEKTLIIHGSLHGPGQIYRWNINFMNESMVDNTARCSCSDNVSRYILNSHDAGMLQPCVSHTVRCYISRHVFQVSFLCLFLLLCEQQDNFIICVTQTTICGRFKVIHLNRW